MGCIPSAPRQDGHRVRDGEDEDVYASGTFSLGTFRTSTDSCPYPRSVIGVASMATNGSYGARQYYPDRPSLLSQLFQTALILAGVGLLGWYLCSKLEGPLEDTLRHVPCVLMALRDHIQGGKDFILEAWAKIDFSNIVVTKPAEWWDTEKVDWDGISKVNFAMSIFTLGTFVLDLLFSSEKKQGNPIMLVPILAYSVVYAIISFNAQATGLLDAKVYMSFDTALIGEKIFKQPQMVVMTFTHLFALDLGLMFVMMKDFYKRISSRRTIYRLMMVVIVVFTLLQGLSTVPIYLVLKHTLFDSPPIHEPRPLPTNRNSYLRWLECLWDPIPRGAGAINGWVQSIPSPLDLPFFVFFVSFGVVRFMVTLFVYIGYVIFLCYPVSAVFFCLRRSWKLLRGVPVQGALYSPFDTVVGGLPPKAVLVVTAHLRLICYTNRSSIFFNCTIGWWLRKFLEAAVMYEFTLPFKSDFSPYIAFLMEEFGPVFPMGHGLGFGSYKDVKAIIENPDQRKSGLSLAWSISSAQLHWSKNVLTSLPEKEIEKEVVAEGRQLVRCWLQDVNDRLRDRVVQKRLDAILPYANLDGTMVDKELIETAFGSTLFHLLTDGDFSKYERKRYHKLLTNAFPFMSDFINKTWFGGILEYQGVRDYDVMRRAFLRYLDAESLQRTLAMAEGWDGWSPAELVRFLVFKFSIAAGAAPAFILSNIVEKMYANPELVQCYEENPNPERFILEMARLERGVPLVNFMAHDFKLPGGEDGFVTIFNRIIRVPDGTPLHCSIQNANRDVSVFGADAEKLNFNRDPSVLGHMLTFNGNETDISLGIARDDHDSPPRRCPGYGNALAIIKFLIDRYRPQSPDEIPKIPQARLAEIKSMETLFQKFVLKMGQVTYSENNRYFPTASEVRHPLDTKGKTLGAMAIVAAGERSVPVYDEDAPGIDTYKDNLTSAVLTLAPVTDDEGEWQNPEEAIAWRTEWFNANFPPANTDYTVAQSVSRMISEIAVSGICCLHTQTVSSLLPSSDAYGKCNDERAVYVNSNVELSYYDVRRGYDRYGAAAYFDAEFNLLGIYNASTKKYLRCPPRLFALTAQKSISKGDEIDLEDNELSEWRHAMWAWRVSALALVTVADHLVNVHMIVANGLVSASRRHLPINHPLRAFLKIFTFRTIGINSKAYKTLIQPKGVVNRNWAFEEDALQELLRNTPNTFKKNFKDYIPESMRNVDDFPANQDMIEFCDIVTMLVCGVLSTLYGSPGEYSDKRLQRSIDNDVDLQAFLSGLASELGLVRSRDLHSFDDIVNVLASLICNVTGMHELVGQISDYFSHPKICGTTIRRGKEMDSIQIYQLNCTLVSSTGLRMPRLMGNWEHLLARNRFADETVPILRKFQEELRALSIRIDQRNRERKAANKFTMTSFDPVHLESSVSV